MQEEVERLNGIIKAQQDELEAISFALGTSEGHSSVDHIVPLRAEVERLEHELRLAVMLAEEVADEWVDPDFCSDAPDFIRLRVRIDQIKQNLKKNDQTKVLSSAIKLN